MWGHKTTDNWRNSWNADANRFNQRVVARGILHEIRAQAGEQHRMAFVRHRGKTTGANCLSNTVFGLYAQATSLNKLPFFGLGPASHLAAARFSV